MSIDPEMNALESDEEDDLFEHFNFTVDKGQQLLRIDKYLLLKIRTHLLFFILENSFNFQLIFD